MVKKNGLQGILDVFKFSTDVITVCPKRIFIDDKIIWSNLNPSGHFHNTDMYAIFCY